MVQIRISYRLFQNPYNRLAFLGNGIPAGVITMARKARPVSVLTMM